MNRIKQRSISTPVSQRSVAVSRAPVARENGNGQGASYLPAQPATPESKQQAYRKLVERFQDLLPRVVPKGATVAVCSRGDEALLQLRNIRAGHFPQLEDGRYAGYHPGSSAEAILFLESLRARGTRYVVFPKTMFWWLDHYTELHQHLTKHYSKLFEDPETCLIYHLDAKDDETAARIARQIRRLEKSRQAKLPKHHLFDLKWYLKQCPDVGNDPWGHYLSTGAKLGYSPHPLFDGEWYLDQNPDLRARGMNPLEHYLTEGARQGLPPHPLFDPKFYWKTYPDSMLSGQSPLEHYLAVGWKKGYRPNPNFDPEFYLSTYPDVAAAKIEPLTHFVTTGLKEARIGNPADMTSQPFRPSFTISKAPNAYQTPIDETIRTIAFHLPQFHAIPENDKWWGKGFTEWTNVRRGKPQFRGHYQPHVPSTLGYYDLSDPNALEKQAEMAREYGIHGFCFYYYWFAGKLLLDRPVQNMLKTGKPAFPFCLCWANENWTRRWDGAEQEILIAQKHSPKDDLAFIKKVEPILTNPNYIRVDGKPLLLVYRPRLLPDARATADRWRDYFRSRGHGELHLAMIRSFRDHTRVAEYGFDASVQFPPHTTDGRIRAFIDRKSKSFTGSIYDYEQTKRVFLEELESAPRDEKIYPAVMPSWDNTARRQSAAAIWVNSSPESYHDWLSTVTDKVRERESTEDRLVFVNAWNEWAEGCHLEPDRKYGFAWLNATKLALKQPQAGATIDRIAPATTVEIDAPQSDRPKVAFVSHDAHPQGAQYCLLTLVTWLKEAGLVDPRFILAGPGPLTEAFARIGPVLQLQSSKDDEPRSDADMINLLKSFCGADLSAVYINSAAAGHVCQWTRHLDVPHIGHVHELEQSIRRWAGKERMSLLHRWTDVVIAASDAVADNLARRHKFGPEQLRVVQSFIRSTRLRNTQSNKQRCKSWLGIPSTAKVVVGSGTTDWRKGPDLFVEVAAKVRRMHDGPIQFIWVGPYTTEKDKKELDQLISERQLSDVVKFVGAVATPVPYMLSSDVFLLSSREDPFPLVCLEAADCGLPVVCFEKAGGMPDFVNPDCGSVVPFLDIKKMATEVEAFLSDPAKAQACGELGRNKVRGQFDVSVKGREIYDILNSVCKARSK